MRKLSNEPEFTPPVLSIANAAKYAGISRATIYNLMTTGRLPSIKLGKRRLIRVADLDAMLDQAGKAA
jgi:excisionase family DNA binding protein